MIRNNHFVDCTHGGSNHPLLWVSPRLNNDFNQQEIYDSNIVFENNKIEGFNNQIIWADRLDGLVFRGNIIKQTTKLAPQYPEKPLFEFKGSKNIDISNNSYEGPVSNHSKIDKATSSSFKLYSNKGIN